MERLWRSKTNYDVSSKFRQQTTTETQLVVKEQSELSNKKQPKTEIQQNLLLPNETGCRIIELEMALLETENLNKENILEMLHVYSQAIEFYEERGSSKHTLYQKKMQSFLHKPTVSEILKGKTSTLLAQKEKNKEELEKAKNQSQFFVKKMIHSNNQTVQKQEDILKKQLQSQQKNLQERLQRKRVNSNMSKRKTLNSASFSVPSKPQNEGDKADDEILISEFQDL